MKKGKFELYTRPTCSDCQDAKAFLAENHIPYTDHDLSKEPEKEKELMKIAGVRMVPTFVFENKSMFGLVNKPKVLIGFEQNFEEIKRLLAL